MAQRFIFSYSSIKGVQEKLNLKTDVDVKTYSRVNWKTLKEKVPVGNVFKIHTCICFSACMYVSCMYIFLRL